MKKFVRGGMILTVLSMCVVFIYASSNETEVLSSANDSQEIFENVVSDTVITPKPTPEVPSTPLNDGSMPNCNNESELVLLWQLAQCAELNTRCFPRLMIVLSAEALISG